MGGDGRDPEVVHGGLGLVEDLHDARLVRVEGVHVAVVEVRVLHDDEGLGDLRAVDPVVRPHGVLAAEQIRELLKALHVICGKLGEKVSPRVGKGFVR